MINGSPQPNGNTAIALAEMKKIFDAEGAQTTIIQVGNKDIRGCIGCGTCARHCPSAAIMMVEGKPSVNEARCLGCGACEYYCPARPVTAIYVEGREIHAEI